MRTFDLGRIRKQFASKEGRANESLGTFDRNAVGIGRYVPGTSPWERHDNGDELLVVMDGEVRIDVLADDGASTPAMLTNGTVFTVPRGRWHQLTAAAPVNILYVSPPEDGVTRQREHPFGS